MRFILKFIGIYVGIGTLLLIAQLIINYMSGQDVLTVVSNLNAYEVAHTIAFWPISVAWLAAFYFL